MSTSRLAVINCLSPKFGNILKVIQPYCLAAIAIHMDEANNAAFDEIDGVIISGGPLLFTDPENGASLVKKFDFIKRLNIPILGICLGHQAIGLTHGAECLRGPERRETDEIEILKPHPLVEGIIEKPVFVEDHCEGLTLPDGFELIGKSLHYAVEIMASSQKPFFGVQFHPEISGEPGEILMRNYLKIVDEYKQS